MTQAIEHNSRQTSMPNSWVVCKLADLVEFSKDKAAPDKVAADTRYIGLEHIEKNVGTLVGHGTSAEVRSTKSRFNEGELLYGKLRPYLNKVYVAEFDGICSTDILVLKALGATFAKYLQYRLLSEDFVRYANGNVSGVQHPRVNAKIVSHFDVELPPLNEQRRIVEKIEELFTKLEAGIRSLEQARVLLKSYRRSVLKAAVEGELSREWRKAHKDEIEPASELLERIMQERREKFTGKKYKEPALPGTGSSNAPESWTHTFLAPLVPASKDSMKTGPFGSLLKKHEHRTDGVPVFGIENVRNMRFVADSKIHVTQEKAAELSGYDAQPGDILISRSGTVGQVCAVPEGFGEARISTNLIRVRLLPNGMYPAFFTLLFNGSPYVLNQVSELCKGSTRDFLNQGILSSLIFPLPPLEEQHFIVEEVERRLSVVDKLGTTVEENLKQAGSLRQSILKRAFSGELVPQDPDDEPASVLLERIRAERRTTKQKSKTKRKTSRDTKPAEKLF